jgi:hypothetical protein
VDDVSFDPEADAHPRTATQLMLATAATYERPKKE